MIRLHNSYSDGDIVTSEVAIIGSGPAGLVMALELARRGVSVVIVESGTDVLDKATQELSTPASLSADTHAPMSIAVRRQLGGNSWVWGGRCVPFDPIDFETRERAGSVRWPVTYEEIREYFDGACRWLQCGRSEFSVEGLRDLPPNLAPGLKDGGVLTSQLERWSKQPNILSIYRREIEASFRVIALTGLTCTRIVCPRESGKAESLECSTIGGRRVKVRARQFVVACGGLESTRLLLTSEGPMGGILGNHSGHLGRWYMAHVDGIIADLRFSTDSKRIVYGFEQDCDGTYVKRRFSFSEKYQISRNLPNIVAWFTNPEFADARHKSGRLSLAYLLLTSPVGTQLAPEALRLSLTGTAVPGTPYGHDVTKSSNLQHSWNVLRHPLDTASFVFGYGIRRVTGRTGGAPGWVAYSQSNRYPLEYHGEQVPNYESRVWLSTERDALGVPRLNIDLRYCDSDIDGVIEAHSTWDEYLRSAGVGQLDYRFGDLRGAVEKRLGGGFHQVGTTRMAQNSKDGVVNRNLAVHGVDNVFVASSSTFVTSGQANSTFMTVAFALRLVDHIQRVLA